MSSIRKGKEGERRVVRLYRAVGFEADRDDAILESTATQHRTTQRTGRDVSVGLWRNDKGELRGRLPLCIQVKERKLPNVWEAYAEASAAAGSGEIPLAHVKRTQVAPGVPAQRLVVLDERHWAMMLASTHAWDNIDAVLRAVGATDLKRFPGR